MLRAPSLRSHIALEEPRSWATIWATALTRPTVATFADLLAQARNSGQVAYGWLLTSSLLSAAILAVAAQLRQLDQPADPSLFLATLLYTGLVVGSWGLFTHCTHWLAQRLHGRGRYADLLYLFAAFSAPLSIVSTLLSLLPDYRLASLALYGYWFLLYGVAVQAGYGISWRRATAVLLLASATLFLLVLVALVGVGYLFL